MTFFDCFIVSLVAVFCGLDRMAVCQLMISRPVVAAPLTGIVLGEPLLGLQVGLLIELLWLGRLPVGASIPPDDTQVAIGGTFLAVSALGHWPYAEPVIVALSLMIAMPLGKFGQLFDHMARRANDNLGRRAERFLLADELAAAERCHLIGIGHFSLSALATFIVIAGIGSLLGFALIPLVAVYFEAAGQWLLLAFPLVGAAMILVSVKIGRSLTLYSASFVSALMMLWLF